MGLDEQVIPQPHPAGQAAEGPSWRHEGLEAAYFALRGRLWHSQARLCSGAPIPAVSERVESVTGRCPEAQPRAAVLDDTGGAGGFLRRLPYGGRSFALRRGCCDGRQASSPLCRLSLPAGLGTNALRPQSCGKLGSRICCS